MVSKFVDSPAAKKVSVLSESVQTHGRAMAKLLKDAEKLRHVLSANVETQTSFEGLYDDIDFKYKIKRSDFEAMAAEHADRVGAAVQKALDAAELDIAQLDSIILHGGASRTPFVQKALEKIAGGDKLRSNVNSDEAAVFGAGFRAAEISPSFRVKEIRISDGAGYAAGMKWTDQHGKPKQQRLWTERSLLGAAAKEITFNNLEDFSISFYQQVVSGAEPVLRDTKVLETQNLTASVAQLKTDHGCADSDISFKVSLRLSSENGEVNAVKALVGCEADEPEKEGSVMDGVKNLFGFGKKDQQPLKEGEDNAEAEESASTTESIDTATTSSVESTATSSTSTESSSEAAESTPGPKKKQFVSIPVEFSLTKSGVAGLAKEDLIKSKDRIKAFEASDRARRQREEALNQLEGFTYKIRDLLDGESFIAASTEEERTALEEAASAASDWLYEDGVDASKDELKSRLKQLKDLVGPIEKRIKESKERPELVQSLKDALNQTTIFVETIGKQIADYEVFIASASSTATSETGSTVTAAPSQEPGEFDGLEDDETTTTTTAKATKEDMGPVPPLYTMEDLKVITTLAQSTLDWLKEKLDEQLKLPDNVDPVLTVKDLKEKTQVLEKAGVDLAMKSVNAGKKKNSSSKKSSKTKKSTKSKTGDVPPDATLNLEDFLKSGPDGASEADIEELLKQLKDHKEKEQEKPSHDEL
ncbi:Hsp70 protein-domain-containing protein [Xylariales sp. PMI_506]|nr:Hsp70 protein-domain-containing protein [Xylariales sp. PMI_506]